MLRFCQLHNIFSHFIEWSETRSLFRIMGNYCDHTYYMKQEKTEAIKMFGIILGPEGKEYAKMAVTYTVSVIIGYILLILAGLL